MLTVGCSRELFRSSKQKMEILLKSTEKIFEKLNSLAVNFEKQISKSK